VNRTLSRDLRPVQAPGFFSPDWDDIPAFLKIPGFTPPRKNQHGLTIADVPAWLHEDAADV